MPEKWVTVQDIADHLGIKKDTVYKWIKTKNMPHHKIGRLVKFQISEIDQWVKEGKAASNFENGKDN